MEARILEASLSFQELVKDILDHLDEEWVAQQGRRRPGGRIDLEDLGDDDWMAQFRFTRDEIHRLAIVLDLPETINCPESRVCEDRLTALCMLLCRLAHTQRLCDVEMQFGWERSRFSRISRLTALALYTRWKHILRFDPNRLTSEKLAYFAAVIHRKGAPLDCVVGFIDGTLRKTARPVRNQRIVYNGWKRIVTTTKQDCYQLGTGCFASQGFEYVPGFDNGYITWVNDDDVAWTLNVGGVGADTTAGTSARPIPDEPLYILVNLGISHSFGFVDIEHLVFPATMRIDWIRVYQDPDRINIGCDPKDRPTSAYINTYIEAYTNPNLTTWHDDFKQPIPRNSLAGDC